MLLLGLLFLSSQLLPVFVLAEAENSLLSCNECWLKRMGLLPSSFAQLRRAIQVEIPTLQHTTQLHRQTKPSHPPPGFLLTKFHSYLTGSTEIRINSRIFLWQQPWLCYLLLHTYTSSYSSCDYTLCVSVCAAPWLLRMEMWCRIYWKL